MAAEDRTRELEQRIAALERENEGLKEQLASRGERSSVDDEALLALRRSEALGRVVCDAVPALLAYFDRDLRYRWCNDAYERWFGVPAQKLVGRRMQRTIDEATFERARPHIEAALAGRSQHFELPYPAPDRDQWLAVDYTPHVAPSGEVLGFVSMVRDATAEKRADEEKNALLERASASEARLRTLSESGVIGITWWDAEGRVIDANDTLLDMLGRTREELRAGKVSWIDVTAPEHADRDQHALEEMLSRGFCAPYEKDVIRADGQRIAVMLGAALWPGSRTEGVAWIVDVSERRRAQSALDYLARASIELSATLDPQQVLERLTRVLVPELGDWCAIYLGDEATTPELVALTHRVPEKGALMREELERFPRDPDASVGYAVVARTGRSQLMARIEDWMLDAFATSPAHAELLRRLGPRSVVMVPLRAREQSLGAMTIGRSESDVSYGDADVALAEEVARRAALALDNARLFEMAQQERVRAETASHAKDEFLAMVSHELRTPLNAILGWATILREAIVDPSDDEAARRARGLEVIARNARAQSELIDDLLDIARVVSGKMRLELARTSVRRVIDAAIDAIRPAATARNVTVDAYVAPGASELDCDAGRVQQIVWNLVSNAVKHSPRGARVDVRARREGEEMLLEVRDEGEGIDPAFLPHVFEPFRQAETGSTRSKGGLGLGLTIVKHLAELHGGTVGAISEGRGHGATFVVRLPSANGGRESAGSIPTPTPVGRGVALEGVRVLVIDDEPDSLELARLILESRGAEVHCAISAREGMRIFDALPPDVLVSDIGMPEEDGYALIEQVRAREASRGGSVPAVALSAFARTEDRARALAAGFDLHVAKPVDPGELVAVISGLAERAHRGSDERLGDRRPSDSLR